MSSFTLDASTVELAVIIILVAINLFTYYLLYREKRRCISCQLDIVDRMKLIQNQTREMEKQSKIIEQQKVEVEQFKTKHLETQDIQQVMLEKTREVAQRIARIKTEQAELQAALQKTQETLQQKEKRIALQEELLTLQAKQISLQAEQQIRALPYKIPRKSKSVVALKQQNSNGEDRKPQNNSSPQG
jgi:chromosome segregation ATPase